MDNRSIRKTKKKLFESMALLLMEKPANKITVKELTDTADLSRGTFYLYYKDTYELLDDIENMIIDDFTAIFVQLSGSDFPANLYSFFDMLFELLDKNKALTAALMSNNGDLRFVNKLKELILANVRDYFESFFGNARHFCEELPYFYCYITDGTIGLVRMWISSGSSESAAVMAKKASMLTELVISGAMRSYENGSRN